MSRQHLSTLQKQFVFFSRLILFHNIENLHRDVCNAFSTISSHNFGSEQNINCNVELIFQNLISFIACMLLWTEVVALCVPDKFHNVSFGVDDTPAFDQTRISKHPANLEK